MLVVEEDLEDVSLLLRVLVVLVEQAEQLVVPLLLLQVVLLIEVVEVEVMVRLPVLFQVLVVQV